MPISQTNDGDKVSKAEANYVDRISIGDAYEPCRSCTMFVRPEGCSKVEGIISPEGHCRFYKPGSPGQQREYFLDQLVGDAESEPEPDTPVIDRSHGVRWVSEMSRDGERVYVHEGLPETVEIDDVAFDPAYPLRAHEKAEWDWMKFRLAKFPGDHGGREPKDEERNAIYEEAHHEAGIPSERRWIEANGIDWKKWTEWIAGEASKIENAEIKNPPPDPDVKPFRHVHGELESTVSGDTMLAFDRSLPPGGKAAGDSPQPLSPAGSPAPTARRDGLAFDRASARSYDSEGRLHVAVTNISKANVCPYAGREIPGSEELGLDPNKVYRLLRHPDELRSAVSTFNRLPLLSKHVPVSADDHQPDLVIGATGSDAEFDDPFLRNSLVIWAKNAIEDVEDESKKELSSAYRYTPDMTPGTYFGEPYDGVMRSIIGNHVALVKEGRAGTDVVVGDEKPPMEIRTMSKITTTVRAVQAHGAIVAFLAPLIAQDQKVDLKPVVAELAKIGKDSALKDYKDALLKSVADATKGKLAKDASVDGLASVIDMLDAHGMKGTADADPPEQVTIEGHMSTADPDKHLVASQHESPFESEDDEEGELPKFLKGKMSEDDYKKAMDMLHGRAKAADNAGGEKKLEQLGAADKGISKQAMDQAIAAAVKVERATGAAIREAEKFVKPWVGELAVAQDSPETIYRAALGAIGMDEKKLASCDVIALRAILEAQPKPGARASTRNGHDADRLAADARGADDYAKMFPEAMRIGAL